MTSPVVLAYCENEIGRDREFLKAFAGTGVDIRVTPYAREPDDKFDRVVRQQTDAAKRSGFVVTAILIHHDADQSVTRRRQNMEEWFTDTGWREDGVSLIRCVPNPCTEAWLCLAAGKAIRPKKASPAAGCSPWKEAWEKGNGQDLDPVRSAARNARTAIRDREDFAAFLREWTAAGLP